MTASPGESPPRLGRWNVATGGVRPGRSPWYGFHLGRRQLALNAAQILLGHSSAMIMDAVYAERDMDRAQEIVAKIG